MWWCNSVGDLFLVSLSECIIPTQSPDLSHIDQFWWSSRFTSYSCSCQICSNFVMLSNHYGPKFLRNASCTFFKRHHYAIKNSGSSGGGKKRIHHSPTKVLLSEVWRNPPGSAQPCADTHLHCHQTDIFEAAHLKLAEIIIVQERWYNFQ